MHDVKVEGFPLSPQQRHLWTLTRDQIGDSPYWSRCVVRIRGPLDVAALRTILDGLSTRYEILRTTFVASEELSMPLQAIPRASNDDGPLVTLTAVSVDEYTLSIGVPALQCDAAGLKNLVADIAVQYAAAKRGTTVDDDVLQYADVSDSLNDILVSTEPETIAARNFWSAKDLSAASTTRMPFERHGANDKRFVPAHVAVRLTDTTARAATRLAADRNVPVETVALTAWQILLQRTLGTDSIVVGCLADGRGYEELRQAVGLFARSLPLTGELTSDVSFGDALQHIARTVSEADALGESFDPRTLPRDRDDEAPFVRLAFERLDRSAPASADDVTFAIESLEATVDRFALKLRVEIDGEVFDNVRIEYDSGRCDEQDVTRLAAQLEQLLASAVANPGQAIGSLDLLPPAQQDEILARAGRAIDDSAPIVAVHRRFEEQAARVPNATAVVCEDARLTYAELNTRANQLAHHLRALGVGADVRVGLCLERSVDAAVGILGIMKAGGAYVPLDPHLPPARIAAMIDETQPAVVVARAGLATALPPTTRMVLLDRDRAAIDQASTSNPANLPNPANPANLAYVLFTSGSTGKPKGVAIEHRQLARYVDAVNARLELPANATYATVTTFAADLGNTTIYPALTSGGCLHIVTEERASDPHAFAEYLERNPIDVLKIVPSHLKALLSYATPERVLPKQRLILGGEACSWDLVDEVHALAPGCVVFNHYGPTETTVGATAFRVPKDGPRPPSATVPIGRPLDHARTYVVDAHGRLAPTWVAGELCIGGAGVARGYLTSAESTGGPFVADPWSTQTGARMYKTGDRVRLLADGSIEFLGRNDHQIKIRGFRVEIGEIESALRRHPRVQDVVVLPHDDGSGMRLAAFLVYVETPWPQPATLKSHLFDQGLPDYMIPASFVGLESLPLTSNGKLDRQRLIGFLELATEDRGEKEPLTEWEALVAGIWKELLAVDDVNPRDNFYDLGGHSLLAIQVVTALEKRAQVQISPRDLVFHTLRQFAALCESKTPRTEPSAANS